MAAPAHKMTPLPELNRSVAEWVNSVRELTQPRAIHWVEGTEAEARELTAQLLRSKELTALNGEEFPGCHLARSAPNDVARVEHLTYICTGSQEDAGPNNHWMDPQQAHARMRELFRGCMRERTLYVIPYCMGPLDSPLSRRGVELTDSPYVVLNMLIMTRAGRAALELIARDGRFVKGLHSIGELDPERALDRELRLGLRRQRPARQEVPCAAHRQLAGTHRGLARRAHADRRPARSARRDALPRLRLPLLVRQDQPRHADPAGLAPRLARVHRGR